MTSFGIGPLKQNTGKDTETAEGGTTSDPEATGSRKVGGEGCGYAPGSGHG